MKQEWVVYAAGKIEADLRESGQVDVDLMQRFTGRLTNLSQLVIPELRRPLVKRGVLPVA